MWQRFTERARRVVFNAQEEASRWGENYVGPEHLLLGLLREEDCVADRLLIQQIGAFPEQVRAAIEARLKPGPGNHGLDMQLTPAAKRVIDLAYEEVRRLQHKHIGTEHLLLGLIREGTGVAAEVFAETNVTLDEARREVEAMQAREA
jgi:ATP-dependent Clp protease ATP-binding subunit ClpC